MMCGAFRYTGRLSESVFVVAYALCCAVRRITAVQFVIGLTALLLCPNQGSEGAHDDTYSFGLP